MRACGRTTGGVLCRDGGCGCCEGRRPRWLAPGTTTSTRTSQLLTITQTLFSAPRCPRGARVAAASSPTALRRTSCPTCPYNGAPAAASTLIRTKRRSKLFGFSHPTEGEGAMRPQRCAGVVWRTAGRSVTPTRLPEPNPRGPSNVFLQHNTPHTSATRLLAPQHRNLLHAPTSQSSHVSLAYNG